MSSTGYEGSDGCADGRPEGDANYSVIKNHPADGGAYSNSDGYAQGHVIHLQISVPGQMAGTSP
ncbi:hypothetical protein [Rhizobium leguminosarum]|uniref:hypothetical protein n=1 Tax=Rhizobium leguminosarum TaxID=384 RepID=UPI0013EF6EDD|nr:hypothetical protein [Rhizobium leguminosarum]